MPHPLSRTNSIVDAGAVQRAEERLGAYGGDTARSSSAVDGGGRARPEDADPSVRQGKHVPLILEQDQSLGHDLVGDLQGAVRAEA